MSVYNPPNFEEYLSVFNPANWGASNTGGIDTAFLDANYLKYPFAQGTENLLDTSINGNASLSGKLTFSDASVMKSLGYISIVSYGADPTGVADSTTAIQNAVNDLTLTNNTLFIPRGRYLISSTIVIQNKQNCNIFSEGCLYCNTLITMIGITNVYNFNINGSLILDGVDKNIGATGLDIYDTVGGYITSDSVNQLSISGLLLTNLAYGAECRAVGFPSKLISNLEISNCTTGLRVRGEYFQFTNINIYGGFYGIFNYGGNNTYTNGIIKTCTYGMIVNNNPALAGNPDHNGCYAITFNHIVSCPIILSYINLAWVVENCNFWANGLSPLGNPLGDNSIVAPTYQSYNCGGVYMQGGQNVNLSNNTFGLNYYNPIVLNGFSGCNIVNNTILQTTGSNYISIIGAYLLNYNYQNLISNNKFSSLGVSVQGVNFDTTFHTANFLYSNTSSTDIINNQGAKVVNVIDSGVSGTVFIDGTCEVYTIVEGTPATIYIANTYSKTFTINYKRTGTYAFFNPPSITTVKIFKPISPGYATPIATPVICDGLFLDSDDGAGNKVIQFQKQGKYIFEPTVNDPILLAGNYTIRPVFPDDTLYYTIPLPTSLNTTDLRSALFFNSEISITDGAVTPNTTVLLQSSSLSGGNAFYIGSKMKIFNNSAFVITLSGTGGTFSGSYGNGGSTITVPDNTWVVVLFDGSNYQINERSANYTYQFTSVSAGVNYTNNFNFTNATLNLSLTSSGLVNIPVPSAQRCHQTTSIYNNIGTNQFTLQISSGTFSGEYGSGTTQLIVPANSWVQIYSDATNWRVDNRSGNQTFYLNGSGTINDWSSNNQYLNSIVEFVASDSAINTNATFTITASITINTNLLVVTATAGVISVGSSITTGGRTYYIISQDYTAGGVAGGIGSYRLSGYFTTAVASGSLTVKPSSNLVNSGTISINSVISNIASATVNTQSSGNTIDAGAQLTVQTLSTSFCNTLERIGATTLTGTYYISAQNTSNITTQIYYSNSATTLLFPVPSASNLGQTITIKNSSYAPVNITTSARSAIFTGKYSSSNVVTVSTSDTAVVPAKNHLLRAQQQGVFRSDGTNWEVVEGTSFEGTRGFFINTGTTSSTADGTISVVPFTPLYTNTSCLYGLVSNCGNGAGSYAVNLYPFPITVQITCNCVWSNPTTTTVVNVIPQRRLGIQYNSASSIATFYLNTNIGSSSIIPPSTSTIAGASISYVLTVTTTPQIVSGVITLNPGDQIAITTTKYNGVSGTESLSGYVYFNRIA